MSSAGVPEQPYFYRRRELVEPDWRRFPGWRQVSVAQWRDARWQRVHCVKNIRQLHAVLGELVDDTFYEDLLRDQAERATMAMLVPPQMLNTMAAHCSPGNLTKVFYTDPVRRYMLPVFSDRRTDWPSHPRASRDSLHERDMWVVDGLTHRYPTKVLAELVSTCPQYCGHCTRMDLVGTPMPQANKLAFALKPADRVSDMLAYLRSHSGVRDVVVSGGDVANLAWPRLEAFITELLAIESIRDIRLATKALMGIPQHWLQSQVRAGLERLASRARSRCVGLTIHTHVNTAQSLTPLVAEAVRAALDAGIREVRNQGVLLRGINDSVSALLDLCYALIDEALMTPYYFFNCDMIPYSEHWRLAVWEAQRLQEGIMGWLPGFSTPRIICDVPFVGKRLVHQTVDYDQTYGISYWAKNYRTPLELNDPEALSRRYEYYDPIHTLPDEGKTWWVRYVKNMG